MNESFVQLRGTKKGEKSIILVGVHGNEKCGVEAIKNLLPNLKIEKGQVWFGFGNPKAMKENKRFIETNLNRMFKDDNLLTNSDKKSYEYRRAQFLKKYLNKADVLLDVHASTTPQSNPFVICEKNAKEIVKFLPVNLVVSGFDKVEPGGTDFYMNSLDKIGICIECGYLGDRRSTQIAEKSIINFLKSRGHIPNNLNFRKQLYVRMYDLYITNTNNFTLSKSFKDFEEISKNQTIGIDGKETVRAKKKSIILFAKNQNRKGGEAFLLGEKKNSLS